MTALAAEVAVAAAVIGFVLLWLALGGKGGKW